MATYTPADDLASPVVSPPESPTKTVDSSLTGEDTGIGWGKGVGEVGIPSLVNAVLSILVLDYFCLVSKLRAKISVS